VIYYGSHVVSIILDGSMMELQKTNICQEKVLYLPFIK